MSTPNNSSFNKHPKRHFKRRLFITTLSILVVTGGFFFGLAFGGLINMDACWKKKCSPAALYAPLYMSVAGLVLSIPIARKIYRDEYYNKYK